MLDRLVVRDGRHLSSILSACRGALLVAALSNGKIPESDVEVLSDVVARLTKVEETVRDNYPLFDGALANAAANVRQVERARLRRTTPHNPLWKEQTDEA